MTIRDDKRGRSYSDDAPSRPILRNETFAGVVLLVAAIAAIVVANTGLSDGYNAALAVEAGPLSVRHWIDEGLMSVFFLLIALDVKREIIEGQLSTWRRRILPGAAAVAGVIVPALVFIGFNLSQPSNISGWAIPAATDVAFALPVLAMLGSRVSPSLRPLLTAIAVIDDLLVILVIAVFYTADLSLPPLAGALAGFAILITANRIGVRSLWPYLVVGVGIWWGVHASGVHATLAGVLVAFTIPLYRRTAEQESPLRRLEHGLQPWVNLAIVPLFGFVSAGISLSGLSLAAVISPLTLGVGLGLLIGKPLGIFGAIWLLDRAEVAHVPDASWRDIYGMSLLCGIGFTISIFISGLTFDQAPDLLDGAKIGVFAGSMLSGLLGVLVLSRAGGRDRR